MERMYSARQHVMCLQLQAVNKNTFRNNTSYPSPAYWFCVYTVTAPFQLSPSCHHGIFQLTRIQVPRSALKQPRDPSAYTIAQEYQADSITYLVCWYQYNTVLIKQVESALIRTHWYACPLALHLHELRFWTRNSRRSSLPTCFGQAQSKLMQLLTIRMARAYLKLLPSLAMQQHTQAATQGAIHSCRAAQDTVAAQVSMDASLSEKQRDCFSLRTRAIWRTG